MEFDIAKYKLLKRAYEKALKENKSSLVFEGQELLVPYTKYLLEYLENMLKIKK